MTGFARLAQARWHREVPGARWFRGDLHVHTIDDAPGGRIHWGGHASGPVTAELIEQYARELLRTAIARGVEVIGLTPHAVYGRGQETLSAVWRIVEIWNVDTDTDGVPFREKIYAVFPGFEASMADGARGVHLIFLFDPEIGREGLVRAFHTVMDGVEPWSEAGLANAGRSAADAFAALRARSGEDGAWRWLCLAPHAFSADQGLFGQLKSQMLKSFRHEYIAGLELGDSQTAENAHSRRPWLAPGMAKHHHAFFHASDAYRLNPDPNSTDFSELGSRTTMFKLAEPRIEALRQAFLAADSRIRLTVRRTEAGDTQAGAAMEPLPLSRPWMRSVTVSGGASFFGGVEAGQARSTTIRFNPDLTCVVGGRMSGKSTLLDGLRVAFGFGLPADPQVRADVEGRGRERFLPGAPLIEHDICGPGDPTAPVAEQWPAVFFTQRELQQAVADQEGLRDLLFQLLPGRGPELREQFDQVAALSRSLSGLVPQLAAAITNLGDSEQALAGASAARDALERYARVGATRLSAAQADVGRIRSAEGAATEAQQALREAFALVSSMRSPEIRSPRVAAAIDPTLLAQLETNAAKIRAGLDEAIEALDLYKTAVTALAEAGRLDVATFGTELARALVDAGGTAEELNQFAALSEVAQQHEERRLRAEAARGSLGAIRGRLRETRALRDAARTAHRAAMSEVTNTIAVRHAGQIRVVVQPDAVQVELERWILSLKERGVTRWWNEVGRMIAPGELLDALDREALADLGMSEQVSRTFADSMSEPGRWDLAAVNTPDRYVLQLQVAPDEYRDMARLSGGTQVSLLLSLLLESNDPRPLIIDQPEEELDKAYLFDVVLPALRLLKGQRQIVFVTHDANIVVNGDADQVVYLKADADHGWVDAEGAIEQGAIRNAILTVLDGGEAAFELRSVKYGF